MTGLTRDEILELLREEYCHGDTGTGSWAEPVWPKDFSIRVEDAADAIQRLLADPKIPEKCEWCQTVLDEGHCPDHGYHTRILG